MKSGFLRAAALAATLALAGCFGDSTPQEQLASIEEMQAKNYPLTEEQQADLAKYLASGKAAMTAGDDEAAGKAFDSALDILKYAESAAIYNKAD